MFEKIIGNKSCKDILEKAILNNSVSHSYMFVGPQGIGKKLIATDFAKAILCLGENKYCNSCKSCIEFNGDNHPDFKIIKPDGNSIKIEQIRELQERIVEKPIISNHKVYIIDNADTMTVEAQNCLLKTLEEPPEFAIIILIGSNENSFLVTIKSRCMILKFQRIVDGELKKYLEQNEGFSDITKSMLELFQGSIGKAINLKDKVDEYKVLEEFINEINKKDIIDLIKKIDILYNSKDNVIEMLEYMNVLLLKKQEEDYRYLNCIEIIEDTKNRIRRNSNYDMSIDNMIFNMWEEFN